MIVYEDLARSNEQFRSELERVACAVIRRGWFILGSEVEQFEREFAAYTGAKHCIGVANGLDALVLAIEALELPESSEILVASNTYIATILAIIRAGHRPVLVEPDIRTYNFDATAAEAAISARTRAICVTHLYGKPCRMDVIMPLADRYGLRVIEDCAQSHGAAIGGRMTGTFGSAGCFSFYPTKNLGALGDAGAVATNDDAIADRLLHLRNYGSKKKYVNEIIGVNSRLDELQAAFLRVKLRALPALTAHKRQLAESYMQRLPPEVIQPVVEAGVHDVFHIFAIRHKQRNELREYLLAYGVQTDIHYPTPPYRQKALRARLPGDYPIADEIHATILSLPIAYCHSVDDVGTVASLVREFVATR